MGVEEGVGDRLGKLGREPVPEIDARFDPVAGPVGVFQADVVRLPFEILREGGLDTGRCGLADRPTNSRQDNVDGSSDDVPKKP